jgi:hypothetical protein
MYHAQALEDILDVANALKVFPDSSSAGWNGGAVPSFLVMTTYHPEFGVSLRNQCLEVQFDSPETVIKFLSIIHHLIYSNPEKTGACR